MRSGLYPKIAADGIRKNGRLYIPYIATSTLMIAVFYIMHMLGFTDILTNFAGSGTAKDMMIFGTYIMAIFGTIFLFYTQSALVKGRLKEFGLYSVLGMNRKDIGKIIFYETVITWAVSMAGGLLAGIGLSKLAELGFAKMIDVKASYDFYLSASSVCATILVYSFIFFLIFLNAYRQVRFADTINLISADKAGEKPPRANWFAGLTGFALLTAGYVIALKIEQPLAALMWFFIAVILVIIGTYLVLISGSVLMCRLLQKNRRFYYKTNHFVSVSSMACRMKRNGASLASICILITMILVMISSTSALYINREQTLSNHYPRQLNAVAMRYGYDSGYKEAGETFEEGINDLVSKYGASITDSVIYYDYTISGYYNDYKLDIDINPMENITTLDYDNVATVMFIGIDKYDELTGEDKSLEDGEAIVSSSGKLPIGTTIAVGDSVFSVKERSDRDFDKLCPDISLVSTIVIVVKDVDGVASGFADRMDVTGNPMICWNWKYCFDTDLNAEGQIELNGIIGHYMNQELPNLAHSTRYCASHEEQRNDFYKTFGGLFFLGILLSVIFLISCVLIIYYKQISEGFEDQSGFGIMQKVGMTRPEIKKSINSQMLMVFFIPIAFACLHLAFVLPIIHKLLMLFGHNNMPLLITCAGVSALICGIFYAVTYKFTSNAYLRIVS